MASTPDDHPRPFPKPLSERKSRIQRLLDNKAKQLQQAGALGERVLAQQIELKEKIRHLQDFDGERGDDEDADTDVSGRCHELSDTVKTWDLENAQLSSAFGQEVLSALAISRSLLVRLCFFPSVVASAHSVNGHLSPPSA